jgi:hypothetical protein
LEAGLSGRVIIVCLTNLTPSSGDVGRCPWRAAPSADAFGRGPEWPRDYRLFDEFNALKGRLGALPLALQHQVLTLFGHGPEWPRDYRLFDEFAALKLRLGALPLALQHQVLTPFEREPEWLRGYRLFDEFNALKWRRGALPWRCSIKCWCFGYTSLSGRVTSVCLTNLSLSSSGAGRCPGRCSTKC